MRARSFGLAALAAAMLLMALGPVEGRSLFGNRDNDAQQASKGTAVSSKGSRKLRGSMNKLCTSAACSGCYHNTCGSGCHDCHSLLGCLSTSCYQDENLQGGRFIVTVDFGACLNYDPTAFFASTCCLKQLPDGEAPKACELYANSCGDDPFEAQLSVPVSTRSNGLTYCSRSNSIEVLVGGSGGDSAKTGTLILQVRDNKRVIGRKGREDEWYPHKGEGSAETPQAYKWCNPPPDREKGCGFNSTFMNPASWTSVCTVEVPYSCEDVAADCAGREESETFILGECPAPSEVLKATGVATTLKEEYDNVLNPGCISSPVFQCDAQNDISRYLEYHSCAKLSAEDFPTGVKNDADIDIMGAYWYCADTAEVLLVAIDSSPSGEAIRGVCTYALPDNDGERCEDGDKCTTNTVCLTGECQGGEEVNVVGTGTCQPLSDAVLIAKAKGFSVDPKCMDEPDKNVCYDVSKADTEGCTYLDVEGWYHCSDGIYYEGWKTKVPFEGVETTFYGACVYIFNDDKTCSDDDVCTDPDTCESGLCIPGDAVLSGFTCDAKSVPAGLLWLSKGCLGNGVPSECKVPSELDALIQNGNCQSTADESYYVCDDYVLQVEKKHDAQDNVEAVRWCTFEFAAEGTSCTKDSSECTADTCNDNGTCVAGEAYVPDAKTECPAIATAALQAELDAVCVGSPAAACESSKPAEITKDYTISGTNLFYWKARENGGGYLKCTYSLTSTASCAGDTCKGPGTCNVGVCDGESIIKIKEGTCPSVSDFTAAVKNACRPPTQPPVMGCLQNGVLTECAADSFVNDHGCTQVATVQGEIVYTCKIDNTDVYVLLKTDPQSRGLIGYCKYAVNTGSSCDNGDKCKDPDVCLADGTCQAGPDIDITGSCPAADRVIARSGFTQLTNKCFGAAEKSACAASHPVPGCTAEWCIGSDGIYFVKQRSDLYGYCKYAFNTISCDDGVACNDPDTCSKGVCTSTGPFDAITECKDMATLLASNPAYATLGLAGVCLDGPSTPNKCTTTNPINGKVCTSVGNLHKCDDKVYHVTQTTNSNGQTVFGVCTFEYNTKSCSDGSACTEPDACSNGACVPGPEQPVFTQCPPRSNVLGLAGLSSTYDSTCLNNGDITKCEDDGSYPFDNCQLVYPPAAGGAIGGEVYKCATAIYYVEKKTSGSSSVVGYCSYTFNTATCSDEGNSCTEDVCGGGVCQHKPKTGASCEADSDACTVDTCNASGVCTKGAEIPVMGTCPGKDQVPALSKVPFDLPCLNGPERELCQASHPVPGCTSEWCTAADAIYFVATGDDGLFGYCKYAFNTASCKDDSACKDPDTCAAGYCVGGSEVTVVDTAACPTTAVVAAALQADNYTFDDECLVDDEDDSCTDVSPAIGCKVSGNYRVCGNKIYYLRSQKNSHNEDLFGYCSYTLNSGKTCDDSKSCSGPDTCTAGECGGPRKDAIGTCPTTADLAAIGSLDAVCLENGIKTGCVEPGSEPDVTSCSVLASSRPGVALLKCANTLVYTFTDESGTKGYCTYAFGDGKACPDEGKQCTTDVCAAGVCTHPNKANNTICSLDSNECTNDVCDGSGNCVGRNRNGALCTFGGDQCKIHRCTSPTDGSASTCAATYIGLLDGDKDNDGSVCHTPAQVQTLFATGTGRPRLNAACLDAPIPAPCNTADPFTNKLTNPSICTQLALIGNLAWFRCIEGQDVYIVSAPRTPLRNDNTNVRVFGGCRYNVKTTPCLSGFCGERVCRSTNPVNHGTCEQINRNAGQFCTPGGTGTFQPGNPFTLPAPGTFPAVCAGTCSQGSGSTGGQCRRACKTCNVAWAMEEKTDLEVPAVPGTISTATNIPWYIVKNPSFPAPVPTWKYFLAGARLWAGRIQLSGKKTVTLNLYANTTILNTADPDPTAPHAGGWLVGKVTIMYDPEVNDGAPNYHKVVLFNVELASPLVGITKIHALVTYPDARPLTGPALTVRCQDQVSPDRFGDCTEFMGEVVGGPAPLRRSLFESYIPETLTYAPVQFPATKNMVLAAKPKCGSPTDCVIVAFRVEAFRNCDDVPITSVVAMP